MRMWLDVGGIECGIRRVFDVCIGRMVRSDVDGSGVRAVGGRSLSCNYRSIIVGLMCLCGDAAKREESEIEINETNQHQFKGSAE